MYICRYVKYVCVLYQFWVCRAGGVSIDKKGTLTLNCWSVYLLEHTPY